MRHAWHRGALLIWALTAPAMVAPTVARAADALSTIPSQMAVAVYVQEWAQALWGLCISQTGTVPVPAGDPVTLPDGTQITSYTSPDGTVTVLTAYPDFSMLLVVTRPDGWTQVVTGSVPSFDGVLWAVDYAVDSSDGFSVRYTSVTDILTGVTDTSGSAQVPGNITQTFHALFTLTQAEIQSAQSDGSTFTQSTPLDPEMYGAPSFGQLTTGTYSDAEHTVSFTLTSTPLNPDRWAALQCDAGEGITGTFAVNADFSGFGQVEQETPQGPALAALVSWTCAGDVQAYSLDGQNLATGPSGAALAFLQHRWETLCAFTATTQGASSTRRDPRRSRFRPRDRSRARAAPRRVVHASAAANSAPGPSRRSDGTVGRAPASAGAAHAGALRPKLQ